MGYSKLKNELVSAANGVDYAYRDTGGGEDAVPLVLLQHFRGNLDNWDPALIDALATAPAGRDVRQRRSRRLHAAPPRTPSSRWPAMPSRSWPRCELSQADLLGFSIGSFVAQQIALIRPAIIRRLVLASSAPQGAAGMHGWAPEVIGAIGAPEHQPGGVPGRVLHPVRRQPAGGPGSRCGACTPGPRTGTRQRPGRPGTLSCRTRSAPGGCRTMPCCSD